MKSSKVYADVLMNATVVDVRRLSARELRSMGWYQGRCDEPIELKLLSHDQKTLFRVIPSQDPELNGSGFLLIEEFDQMTPFVKGNQ